MKKHKKIFIKLLFLISVLSVYSSSLWAACDPAQFISDVTAFTNVSPSGITTTICNHQVVITSPSGNLSRVSGIDTTSLSTLANQGNVSLATPVKVTVDGKTIITGDAPLTPADLTAFHQALGFIITNPIITNPVFSSTSLASTSPSSKINSIVYNSIINPSIESRSQLQQQQDRPMQKLFVTFADLKYERAEFTDTHDKGNIGGFTAKASYDISKNFTVGAIIPYDYLSFNTFDAHRTGIVLYGKNILKLPSHFELTTAINTNYLYTTSQLRFDYRSNNISTFGGGMSTRLKFDNNSNFVPSVAFSYQYNSDNTNIRDNHQSMIKLGPSLGYRLLENATIEIFGTWNKDITKYYTQKSNDTDYYDLGLEGTWGISDMWQLKGGWKKVLGLKNFESDTFFLGSSLRF